MYLHLSLSHNCICLNNINESESYFALLNIFLHTCTGTPLPLSPVHLHTLTLNWFTNMCFIQWHQVTLFPASCFLQVRPASATSCDTCMVRITKSSWKNPAMTFSHFLISPILTSGSLIYPFSIESLINRLCSVPILWMKAVQLLAQLQFPYCKLFIALSTKHMQYLRNKYFKQLRVHLCGTKWSTVGNLGGRNNNFHSFLSTVTFSKHCFLHLLVSSPLPARCLLVPSSLVLSWWSSESDLNWCARRYYTVTYAFRIFPILNNTTQG